MQLYRHALKNVISWAVRREIFYEEVRLRKDTSAGAIWTASLHRLSCM